MFFYHKKYIFHLFLLLITIFILVSVCSAEIKFLFSFPTQKILGENKTTAKGRTLCLNSNDSIYVVIPEEGEIWNFSKSGKFIAAFGNGRFIEPSGIAIDNKDRIYISDLAKNIICVFNKEHKFIMQFPIVTQEDLKKKSCAPFISYNKLTNQLFVSDSCNHQISIYSTDGNFIDSFGHIGTLLGEFNGPSNIAFNSKGHIFIVDLANFRVQAVSPDFKPLLAFGKMGIEPARFVRPYGIAVGRDDSVFVSDFIKADVQQFSDEGVFLNILGKGTTYESLFKQPLGIAFSGDNKLYILDGELRRIYVFQI